MPIDSKLLEILVCPKSKSSLVYDEKQDALRCDTCALYYPIVDGVPIMIEDEAYPVMESKQKSGVNEKRKATFEVVSGSSKGQLIKLPLGTCKVIGRSLDDLNKTQAFSMDATMTLDDLTQKLVKNFISRHKKKEATEKQVEEKYDDKTIGGFNRLPDLILNDPLVSRLHAMLFHGVEGAGVLDLVSKNGTFVNEKEVESKQLSEGDQIEIGHSKFIFNYQ